MAVVPVVKNSSGQLLKYPRKRQTACARLITRRKYFVTLQHGSAT